MRLWTLQLWPAWEVFQDRGVLRADGRRAWPNLRMQYRWMMEQMEERIPGYGGRFPIWAWYEPKPDLRGTHHFSGGQRAVRIEFEVPEDRVLLSHFGTWHIPLNEGYFHVACSEAELDAAWEWWEERSGGGRWDDLSPELKAEVKQSWERIFDLDHHRSYPEMYGTYEVQAVLEEVWISEVVKVTPFTARHPARWLREMGERKTKRTTKRG
ncbi:MAG TPA: DUF3841 domain-containing protein [Thermomicrobiaceae bacterium]|nr:DUF3841 domain-containing protein [Thermomicrobiaceae bacterium]